MKAPLTWLKDYVEIDVDVTALADKLLHAGFEVEEISYLGAGVENVVVGKIAATEKHPNADKLTICKLDVGKEELLQIVTGASNVKAGDWVPVCLDGARLPGGKIIRDGELRGVESRGMLCSGSELGLTEEDYPGAGEHGILLLDPKGLRPGQDVRSAVGLDEYVLDVGVTANRPDCQSILGLAREVGAVLGKPVKSPCLDFKEGKGKIADYVSVSVSAPDLCPRYMAGVVTGIAIAPSPKFLRDRLRWAGLRPINNIVDITNFVLLELGQPMHAFDLAKIHGGIEVRRARKGESITTLDGKNSVLDPDVLVIADDSGPVALAGIMGGENSGIAETTSSVMFECAKFNRQNVRRVSRRLGVRSDSSAMYERGVYAYTTGMAIRRALSLISELGCGNIVGGSYDLYAEQPYCKSMDIPAGDIDKALGISIPPEEMVRILKRLSFGAKVQEDPSGGGKGLLHVEVPPYREDIDGPPDIAEEIIRLYGYDNIQGSMLPGARVLQGGRTPAQSAELLLTEELTGQGFSEIVTYSFVGERDYDMLGLAADDPRRRSIRLVNPLGEDISLMRTTLAASMLSTVARNLSRKNLAGRLYELARTYRSEQLPPSGLPEESPALCLAAWGEDEDFFSMKGSVGRVLRTLGCDFELARSAEPFLHPGRGADIRVNGKRIGYFGEAHPETARRLGLPKRAYLAELDLSGLLGRQIPLKYREIPRFPAISRDLAVTCEEKVTCGELTDAIRSAGGNLLEEVRLFDVFTGSLLGEGKKSLAFTLRFRSPERTLVDGEVEKVLGDIVGALESRCGARLRQ